MTDYNPFQSMLNVSMSVDRDKTGSYINTTIEQLSPCDCFNQVPFRHTHVCLPDAPAEVIRNAYRMWFDDFLEREITDEALDFLRKTL